MKTNRMKVAECLIIKQENLYLREYIEHCISVGFDNVILYDNNTKYGENPHAVIGDYIGNGYVIYNDVRGINGKNPIQMECYERCFSEYGNSYDYIAFFDCDEYLTLVKHHTVRDLLNEPTINDADVINLNWMCYGDNGQLHYTSGKIQDRFPERMKSLGQPDLTVFAGGMIMPVNCFVKSIVKCNHDIIVKFESPHTPRIKALNRFPVYKHVTGDEVDYSLYIMYNYEVAYLKHYYTMTVEEYAIKRFGRGTVASELTRFSTKHMFNTFFTINSPTKEKVQILEKYANISHSKCAVIAIAKNENLYIREWTLYYVRMGFDNIIIYDDNNVGGERLECVIGDLIEDGVVIINNCNVLNMGNEHIQLHAYNEGYNKYHNNYDWLLFVDCDEFLDFTNAATISEYVDNPKLIRADGVQINWKCYGDNGKLHYSPEYVQFRFIKPMMPLSRMDKWIGTLGIEMPVNSFTKTLVHCKNDIQVNFENPHVPDIKGLCRWPIYVNNSGQIVDGRMFIMPEYSGATIRHYYTYTIEEFLYRRFGRCKPNETNEFNQVEYDEYKRKQLAKFFSVNDETPEKTEIITKFFEKYENSSVCNNKE